MEYTIARKRFGEMFPNVSGIGKPGEGTIVQSEFISSARVMRGAVVVNPWREDEVL